MGYSCVKEGNHWLIPHSLRLIFDLNLKVETNISLRLIFYLNLKVETAHLLQEHIVKYLYKLGVVNI